MKKVVIIDYGAGNLFSVQQALKRLGIEPVVSDNQAIITNASHVVFPGVGHAKTAMEQLKVKALDVLIPQLKQPVLGICLGMQLLCEFTEEGAVEGLGVFRSRIELLSDEMIRSEEHTSELQSQSNLVCRLLLLKKTKKYRNRYSKTTSYLPPPSQDPARHH